MNTKKAGDLCGPGFLEALFLLNNVYFFAALTNYINSFFWRNGCFKKQFAAKNTTVFYHINKFLINIFFKACTKKEKSFFARYFHPVAKGRVYSMFSSLFFCVQFICYIYTAVGSFVIIKAFFYS
jgi:hypothetical protein